MFWDVAAVQERVSGQRQGGKGEGGRGEKYGQ